MPISPDVIVIGGSAGAVEGLLRLVPGLPAALAARIFITVHVPASVSALPAILTRAGHMPARHPVDREPTEPSAIYLAPPDHHLLVKRGSVRVVRGPRENGHRPAIDPLFRSAAAAYGPRVLCVVLSGNLDDGSAGAAAVYRAGGTVIVQDPAECVYPSIPSAAIDAVPGATVLPLDQIAPHLCQLLATPLTMEHQRAMTAHDSMPVDPDPVEMDEPAIESLALSGVSSGLTCPECHGGVFEVDIEGTQQFRCRVGHAFTADVLFAEQGGAVEAALWTALRALEESAEMADRLRSRATRRGNSRAAASYAHSASTYEQRARVIRDLLRTGSPVPEVDPLEPEAHPVQG